MRLDNKSHRGLPSGTWSRAIGREENDGEPPALHLQVREAVTEDCVMALILIGDGQDYARDCGVRRDIGERLWHLARITERVAKARGGTSELLGYLADLADEQRAWVVTEVFPSDIDDAPMVCGVMKRHGGFVECNCPEADGRLLMRRPRRWWRSRLGKFIAVAVIAALIAAAVLL